MAIKIENYVNKYLPHSIIDPILKNQHSGTALVKWVKEQGYEVVDYYDTERNGLVKLKIGSELFAVSTNGYVYKYVKVQGREDIDSGGEY